MSENTLNFNVVIIQALSCTYAALLITTQTEGKLTLQEEWLCPDIGFCRGTQSVQLLTNINQINAASA